MNPLNAPLSRLRPPRSLLPHPPLPSHTTPRPSRTPSTRHPPPPLHPPAFPTRRPPLTSCRATPSPAAAPPTPTPSPTPAQRLADALAITPRQAEAILTANVALGNRKPATLARNLTSLAALLSLPLPAARRLALKQPSLLCYAPPSLSAKLTNLAAALATTPATAAALVIACPSLLCPSPPLLSANIALLRDTLALTPPQLLPLLRRQPQLALQAPLVASTTLPYLQAALALPPPAALKLALTRPQLLCYRPSTLDHKLSALAALLSTTPETAAALCVKQPSLLCSSPDTLAAHHAALQALLRLPPAPTSGLLLRTPQLLLLNPDTLRQKTSELSHHLALPALTTLRILQRHPHLLTSATAPLAARLAALSAALALPPADISKMVHRHPPLARMSPDTIAAKLDTLAASLHLPRPTAARLARQQPTLLCLSHDTLQSRVGDLAAALGIPPADMAKIAAQRPTLLTRSPRQLAARLPEYAASLGVAPEAVGKALAQRPALLSMSPATVAARRAAKGADTTPATRVDHLLTGGLTHPSTGVDPSTKGLTHPSRKAPEQAVPEAVLQAIAAAAGWDRAWAEAVLEAIAAAAGRDRAWAEALVQARPALAKQGALEGAARRLRWLVEGAGSCEAWRRQWEGYSPGTVAALLAKDDRVYERLRYLVRRGEQGVLALASVLVMSAGGFGERWPEFGARHSGAAVVVDPWWGAVDPAMEAAAGQSQSRSKEDKVEAVVEVVGRGSGRGRSWAEAVVGARPKVAQRDAGRVARRLRWLVEAAGSCEAWRRQWEVYTAGTVAVMLTRGDGVYERLRVVGERGAQGEVAMSTVLLMTEGEFERLLAGLPQQPDGGRGTGGFRGQEATADMRRRLVDALLAEAGRERGWAEAVVAARPKLAKQAVGRVARRLRWLVEAAGSCEAWRRQWQGYGPGTVAALLGKDDGVYERLERVSREGQQGRLAMSTVLMMGRGKFASLLGAAVLPAS